jgi:hypothetical protein
MFLFGRNGVCVCVCVCVCVMRVESAARRLRLRERRWMDGCARRYVSNVRRSRLRRSTSPTTKPVSFPRPRAFVCVVVAVWSFVRFLVRVCASITLSSSSSSSPPHSLLWHTHTHTRSLSQSVSFFSAPANPCTPTITLRIHRVYSYSLLNNTLSSLLYSCNNTL